MVITLEPGEDIDSALKRLKKRSERSGLLWDIKKATGRYVKKGVRKRQKRAKARNRATKLKAYRAAKG
jgi:ribosomal protein S21